MFEQVNEMSTPEQRESYGKLLRGEVSPNLNNVDDFCVSPMFGFKDRHDYRRQCSVKGRLKELKLPCFFLHAWDDFLLGPKCIPHEEF